jgi:uncharacterized membrane protein
LAHDDPDIRKRLEQLESRLARIERALGLPTDSGEQKPVQPKPEPPKAPATPTTTPKPEPPKPPAAPVQPPKPTPETPTPRPANTAPKPLPQHVGGRSQRPAQPTLSQRLGLGSDSKPFSLEQFLGAKAFAVAGSLIVVVAVVLFLKYAYDQGWIKLISPTWRCLIGAMFGIALIVTGEGVRKRIGAFASSGLTATGLATLYATVLVARHIFELMSAGASFALLLLVTLTGIGLGAKDRRLFMVFLSLASAYAVPFIVGAVDPSPYVFPGYLIALLTLGLALAAILGGAFRSLRPTVWGATALLGGLWIATIDASQLWTSVVFVTAVWALIHAELVLSVMLRRRPMGARVRGLDGLEHAFNWLVSIPAPSVSLSATVWSAICMIVVVRRVDVDFQALPTLALAIACALIAWRLAPTFDVLRGRIESVRSALATSLAFQSAALIIASIALHFSGNDQDLAWLVLASAACVLGRRLDATPVVTYGLITLAILIARLFMQWSDIHSGDVDWFEVSASAWVVKVVFAAMATLIAALCSERFGRGFMVSLTGLAVALLMATPLVPGAEAGNVALVWSGVAVLALIGSGGKRWLELDSMAMGVATLVTLPALLAWIGYMADGSDRGLFLASVGVAIALQLGMATLAERRLIVRVAPGLRFVTTGGAVLLLALYFITPDTESGEIVLIWSGLGAALVGAGWRRRWLSLDLFGAALSAITIVAWLVRLLVDIRESDSFVWNLTLAGGVTLTATLWLSAFSMFRSRRLGAPAGDLRRMFGHSLCTLGVLVLLAATSNEAIRADDVLNPTETAQAAFLCIWWAAFGLIALGLARVRILDRIRVASLSLTEFAGVMALVSPLPWLVHLISEYRDDAFFVWNLTLGSGVAATIGLWFAAYALLHRPSVGGVRDHQRLVFGKALGATGAVVLLVATSIEASRAGRLYVEDETARQALLSIWWALYGVAGLVFGSIQLMRTVRLCCLILIGLAALKVVVYDLTNVSPLWRIASSLALGMLMLLIGVAYARSVQRGRDGERGSTPSENAEGDAR